MFHYFVIIFVVVLSCRALPEEIPSFIKICNQTDPKLGSCIRKSIIGLRPHLIQGIPELDIPSLDPLYVPELKIAQNGGIQVAADFKNISISGPCKFRLRAVRADVGSDKFRMKVWFPELVMRATYEIRGQLLMMPINGKGSCYGNFSDIDGIVSLKLKRINKNGEKFFKVDFMTIEVRTENLSVKLFSLINFMFQFNIGGARVQLDNLFNGDPELSRAMNQFINENWRMVAAEIRPTLEKTIADILMQTADKFFEAYPIKKLLFS